MTDSSSKAPPNTKRPYSLRKGEASRAAALLAGIVLLWPSQGLSQEFCQIVEAIQREKDSRFRRLRGPLNEIGDYVSRVTLPGADECYIDRQDPEFVCVWRVPNSEVDGQTQTFISALRGCYPAANFRDRSTASRPAFTLIANEAAFRVHADPRKGRIFLGIQRDE